MSTVSERATPSQTPPSKRPSHRGRWLLGGLIVLLLLGFGAVVAADALSMVRHAKRAQAALESFKNALSAGDDVAAKRDLADAKSELSVARHRYQSAPVRVAGWIPFLGWPVDDAGRLLRAATHVAVAGDSTISLYDQTRGGNSKLFHNDTVSLSELHAVTGDADHLVAELSAAQAELRKVHAAFWEPSIGSARDKALRQVTPLLHDGRTGQRLLALAPGLVGADGPRTYLIAVLNPAELQDAGGSALNLLTARFVNGHMTIVKSGSTLDLTNENQATTFASLPEDPWLSGPKHVLAAADRSPDWRTSGQELMRGYTAQFGTKLDGIIGLDPIAMQGLMNQIGPFTTPGYGQISAGNIVQTLLVDSYTKFPDYTVRHAYNDELMTTLLHLTLGGGHMLGKGKEMQTAAAGGHLQIYMNDPKVQSEVESGGLLRVLPQPSVGDVVGVYTTNTNASKVDFWQKRTITQNVHVNADGSADVERFVTVDNATPPYTAGGVDIGSGYLTRQSRPAITLYMGAGSSLVGVTVDGKPISYVSHVERGLPVIILKPVRLKQGQSAKVALRYHFPAGSFRDGKYRFAVTAQPTVLPVPLTVAVSGSGSCAGTGAGWSKAGNAAQYRLASAKVVQASVACGG